LVNTNKIYYFLQKKEVRLDYIEIVSILEKQHLVSAQQILNLYITIKDINAKRGGVYTFNSKLIHGIEKIESDRWCLVWWI
jgi:hypothetical protein